MRGPAIAFDSVSARLGEERGNKVAAADLNTKGVPTPTRNAAPEGEAGPGQLPELKKAAGKGPWPGASRAQSQGQP